MKIIFINLLLVITLFSACKKDNQPDYNNQVKADLSIEFDNIVGGSDLHLNTGTYTNAVGEKFSVTKLKYYVSNFELTTINGEKFVVPQDSCYFLIDESDPSSTKPIIILPEGEYKTLFFTLGVDSLRNTKDISERTGALDPTTKAADMYWGWNSGYIFYKLDGTFLDNNNVFQYHVGGFGGYSTPTPNNIRNITIDLSARGTPKIKVGKKTNVHLFVDVLKVLGGSTNMSFVATPMIHSPLAAIPLANNYVHMFTHDHTEN